jgi:hypothetical protein
VLFVLLLGAASAEAKTYFFEGNGLRGNESVTVSFEAHGTPRGHRGAAFALKNAHLEEFDVSGATQTITCGPGDPTPQPVGYHFDDPINVQNDGDFKAKKKLNGAGDQSVRVSGQFNSGFFFVGTFRLGGTIGGCTVDTGLIRFDGAVTQ